jgi:hypothetical protein
MKVARAGSTRWIPPTPSPRSSRETDPETSADHADESYGVVFGRVELAGKVIEHETGYRAERAHIAELIPTTTDGGVTRSLARRLELPLGPTWDTSALVREMQEMEAGGQNRLPHPGLRDRLRLRLHRRRFHVIQGALD